VRSRRLSALREFAAERGELALRALGGRREAERFLAGQDPEVDVRALVAALEREAGA
jgi:LAO/AO transport system kinase